MNSSGILKRGLAATAISALAISGIPALTTSANALPGDANFTVLSTGPALNDATQTGAVVVIRALDSIDPTLFKTAAVGSDVANSEDTGSQTVGTPTVESDVDDPSDSAFQRITLRIPAFTNPVGGTAKFRLFEDSLANNNLDATEPRADVSISTAGPVASIEIAPMSQTAPQGVTSGAYTVTIKDAGGRTTQLADGDQLDIAKDAAITVTETGPRTVGAVDNAIESVEIATGVDTFTAKSTDVATAKSYPITLTDKDTPAIKQTAQLTVVAGAALVADEVDIVTGADTWKGFGGGDFGAPSTKVGVNESSILVNIKSNDPFSTVTLTLTGTGITFGGKPSTTVSTVLDGNGVGSLTITPDAGTVQDGDAIDIAGSFAEKLEFERSAVDATNGQITADADPYFSKVGGTVDVTLTVVDQFGNPVTSGFVEASRQGANKAADIPAQRKAVGSDGKVTFTFTDTKATNGTQENVDAAYFKDAATPAPGSKVVTAVTVIKYTTDGQGPNYTTSFDTQNTEAPGYKASDVTVVPLADAVADNDGGSDESVALDIDGGDTTAGVKLSVDNGALILKPGQNQLSQGVASVDTKLTAGSLPAGYKLIGTKSGVVTLTIVSGNRTETAQFTVLAEKDLSTARNVAVSGPAEVANGATQVSYTAVVTDAFGNPVVGLGRDKLNVQVSGDAEFQDGDAVTNDLGEIKLNVRLDNDAAGDVTIRVQGIGSQFGAAADRVTTASNTDDGKGLAKSADVATATTKVKGAVTPPPGKADIVAKTKGQNNGGKNDKVKIVTAPRGAAAGAKVVLFKVFGNKTGNKKQRVAIKRLDGNGKAVFIVKDENGNKKTRYFSRVKGTADSKRARSNNRGLR